MLRNDSDKFECAACGGLKPGAEPSQDQKKDTKTSLFVSTGQSSGSVFSLASATSSTGAGFSFGSAGASQIDSGFSSFGSFGETQNSKSGTPIRFGFFQQEERVTEQLTEENKESDSPTVEETPRNEVEDKKDKQAQNVQDTDTTTDEAQAEDNNKEETKPVVENVDDEVEGKAATDETLAEIGSRQETVLSGDPTKIDTEEKPLSSGEESFQRQQNNILKQTSAESGEAGNYNLNETPDETHFEEKSSPSSEDQPMQGIPGDSGTEKAKAENNYELNEEGTPR